MTKKELNNLSHIKERICRIEKEISSLSSKILKTTSLVKPNFHNAPKDDYQTELITYKDLLIDMHTLELKEKIRLETYINTIPDVFMQNIFAYRFIDRLPYRVIANKIGGYNTADSVRKSLERYISK